MQCYSGLNTGTKNTLMGKLGAFKINFFVLISIPWSYKMSMLDITLLKMLTLEAK